MPEENKIKIEFTDKKYITEYGRKPLEVPPGLAKKYMSMGIVKILESPPNANINPKIKFDYVSSGFDYFDDLLDKVCWIGSNSEKAGRIIEVGYDLGFNIVLLDALNFNLSNLTHSSFVVIENDIPLTFKAEQIRSIKSIIFQRNKPFIYLCTENDSVYFWETRSKMSIVFGETKDPYEFWREAYYSI